jgi:hypothetical protein
MVLLPMVEHYKKWPMSFPRGRDTTSVWVGRGTRLITRHVPDAKHLS